MKHSKPFVDESQIQQKSHAGISPDELMRWIIAILFISLCAYLIFGAYKAHAESWRQVATRDEISLVHAIEMNCRAPGNDCALYVANPGKMTSFLRLVLANGDDNPTQVQRGDIFRIATELTCTKSLPCKITTERVDDTSDTVIVTLSSDLLEQKLLLTVPCLGDEY
jgi:hypothetical protein